jgi:hypothetical protein
MRSIAAKLVLLATLACFAAGCATYTTPGRAANLAEIDRADIRAGLAREPAASFPARIAVARVQARGYRSYSAPLALEAGAFDVLTVQELLRDEQLDAMGAWPAVAGVAPLSRLLLAEPMNGLDDLRVAAAKVQADVLLLYTLDTELRVKSKSVLPLAAISLGTLPDREAHVTSTASAMFVDVRTGFVYGLGEATAREQGLASFWTSAEQVDRKRVAAEQRAFGDLLGELERTWRGIERQHARAAAEAQPGSDIL